VCPGFTDFTDLVAGSIDTIMKKDAAPRNRRWMSLQQQSARQAVTPAMQVADTVLWLCGEGAGAVTGQARGAGRRDLRYLDIKTKKIKGGSHEQNQPNRHSPMAEYSASILARVADGARRDLE